MIASAAGGKILITRASVAVAGTTSESVTPTVNENVPADSGTPVIAPYASRLRPVGREPVSTVHEYGATPPVAPSCW